MVAAPLKFQPSGGARERWARPALSHQVGTITAAAAIKPAGIFSYAVAAAEAGAAGAPQQHAAQAAEQSCSCPPDAGCAVPGREDRHSELAPRFVPRFAAPVTVPPMARRVACKATA
jgi:hypothetical protein